MHLSGYWNAQERNEACMECSGNIMDINIDKFKSLPLKSSLIWSSGWFLLLLFFESPRSTQEAMPALTVQGIYLEALWRQAGAPALKTISPVLICNSENTKSCRSRQKKNKRSHCYLSVPSLGGWDEGHSSTWCSEGAGPLTYLTAQCRGPRMWYYSAWSPWFWELLGPPQELHMAAHVAVFSALPGYT